MRQASVLAHQGVQEGSGTCNFFSNGYYGQVLRMWTGVAALGAGLRHDERLFLEGWWVAIEEHLQEES